METKQKRTKAKIILSIILPVLLITGILAISGHAAKPPSPPGLSKPVLITVSGGIEGSGTDAAKMAVTLNDVSFGEWAGSYIANPDGKLRVSGTRKSSRTLRYYYCDAESHATETDICGDTEHDPFYYKCLIIRGGTLVDWKISGKGTEQIVFSAESPWEIWRKPREGEETGVLVANDVLGEAVTYTKTKLD
ncbi:hypothetical protein ACFL3Q_07710 [Planctomycetota bacterium]